LLLLVVLSVLSLVLFLMTSGHQIDTLDRFKSIFRQAGNPDLVLGPNRWAYYSAALTLIFQSPVIGHGVRSFSLLLKGIEDPGAHPHNMFLEILADTGVIGLVLFLLVLVVALRPLSRARLRADPMLLCVTMLFLSRFIAAMVGADLVYQQPLFLFLGLLALTAAPGARRAGKEENAAVAAGSLPGRRAARSGAAMP
jgi:O-antigen ligase